MTINPKQEKLQRRLRLKRLVKKKRRELVNNGYQHITEEAIWEYLLDYRWKKVDLSNYSLLLKDVPLVTSNDFFDYQMIKAQTANVDKSDWKDLNNLLPK